MVEQDGNGRHMAEMVREIRKRTGVEKYVVEKVLKAFFDVLTDWMLAGVAFTVMSFAVFRTRTVKAHTKRNLRSVTGEVSGITREFPETTHPVVHFSPRFKKRFQKGEE